MCINCSEGWRGAKKFGPISYGSGQICEDPKSWIAWVRIAGFYLGFIPATCYWKGFEFKPSWSSEGWMLGGGKVRKYNTPNTTSIMFGPFDISFRRG